MSLEQFGNETPKNLNPIIDAEMEVCEKKISKQETKEHLRAFLETYFSEAIKNMQNFTSEKFDASFPYTVVRLKDVAESLYQNMGYELSAIEQQQDSKRAYKEFMFGTMFNIGLANPLQWIEHGIDQVAKKLPAALEALSKGEEVEDLEIYAVGSPVGELGIVNDSASLSKDKPFEKMGEMYAEFVGEKIHNEEKEAPIVRLWGHSMGASVVATTADALLKTNEVCQNFDQMREKKLPYLSVNMQAPVGSNDVSYSRWKIPLGFALQSIGSVADPYWRRIVPQIGNFSNEVHKLVAENGVAVHMTDADVGKKKEMISLLIGELREGVAIPEGLKTNEVIGVYDPLMYSEEVRLASEKREWEEAGKHSLAQNIIHTKEEERRRFAIQTTHDPAIVRDSYYNRLIKAAESMDNLAQK